MIRAICEAAKPSCSEADWQTTIILKIGHGHVLTSAAAKRTSQRSKAVLFGCDRRR